MVRVDALFFLYLPFFFLLFFLFGLICLGLRGNGGLGLVCACVSFAARYSDETTRPAFATSCFITT